MKVEYVYNNALPCFQRPGAQELPGTSTFLYLIPLKVFFSLICPLASNSYNDLDIQNNAPKGVKRQKKV